MSLTWGMWEVVGGVRFRMPNYAADLFSGSTTAVVPKAGVNTDIQAIVYSDLAAIIRMWGSSNGRLNVGRN